MPDDSLDDLDFTPVWLRRLSWDALPCEDVPHIHELLGLTPSQADMAELEHADSHTRMEYVSALVPSIDKLSDVLANILSTTLIDATSREVSDTVRTQLLAQNAEIIRIATLVIVAQFMSSGVLAYTEKALP